MWYDFDLHDRLSRWGTARETKDDDGVRLPEVRLILSFEKDIEVKVPDRGHQHLEQDIGNHIVGIDPVAENNRTVAVTHYIDAPLWRVSNVMNKLARCSDNLTG